MKDRPLCEHGNHDDKNPWCEAAKKALAARIDFVRIGLGADFETHGGKKVMCVGDLTWLEPLVPLGSIGVVESTHGENVYVHWKGVTGVSGTPDPLYMHGWPELEVLKTDEDGNIPPEEIARASRHRADRILRIALPCPFCGGSEVGVMQYDEVVQAHCGSHDCWAGGPRIRKEFGPRVALAAWNIRGSRGCMSSLRSCGFEEQPESKGIKIVDELKGAALPCPFCTGTRLRIMCDNHGTQSYHGRCTNCGTFAPHSRGLDKSPAEVMASWKRREATDAQQEEERTGRHGRRAR